MKENKDILDISFVIESIKEKLEKAIGRELFIRFISQKECSSNDKIPFWIINTEVDTKIPGIGICVVYYAHSKDDYIRFNIGKDNVEYLGGSYVKVQQIIKGELETFAIKKRVSVKEL